MLQAVVRQDHIKHLDRAQATQCSTPIPSDNHRQAGLTRNQDRLVAEVTGGAVGQHLPGESACAPVIAAVTARNHADAPAARRQAFGQGNEKGCLAGTANQQIADDDDCR